MAFRIVGLDPRFDLDAFDCGEPARNEWLRKRAAEAEARDDARTYLVVTGAREVAGYCAVAVGSVLRASLPGALRRNAPDPVGVILLAQLGVALPHQRIGLGRELVLHAMRRAVAVADIAGARLFAVHPATDELRGYYARFGLRDTASDPPLMAMSLRLVRATLAAAEAGGTP